MNCPKCEIPIEDTSQTVCPRCDSCLRSAGGLHSVDIAHNGEDWCLAKKKIDESIDYALYNNCKGVKIIHGYGSQEGHTHIIHD